VGIGGTGVGVSVGSGVEVAVEAGVAVGGNDVGVAVGETGVAVGGRGVGVAIAMAGLVGVGVGIGVGPQPAITSRRSSVVNMTTLFIPTSSLFDRPLLATKGP
jgi:hypothetical protein